MSNRCKETYDCSHCCSDTFVWMTMKEFSIFAAAWMLRGIPVVQASSKDRLILSGPELAEKNPGKLFYAANRTLDEHINSGRYGNTKVLAIFRGKCANNDPDTGDCTIEDKKPKDCKDFAFDGSRCREIRNSHSTSFIPLSSII